MMSRLVDFSLRFSGVVVGFALLILGYGIYQLGQSKLDVFPEFSPTQLVIQTEAQGFSAELVESLITQPIENGISGTVGIKTIRSQSIPGLSVITIIFEDDSDIYRNRQIISERLVGLGTHLPTGVVPNITPLTSAASTILGIGITSTQFSLMELRDFVDWTLRPHLMSVRGVADVNVFGGEVRQFLVQVDVEKLLLYQVSLQYVRLAVSRATGVVSSGFLENSNQRIVVNVEGQTLTTEKLADTMVIHKDGQSLRLSDVAKVESRPLPLISAAQINGREGIYLSVQGQLGGSAYQITQDLEKSLRDISPLIERKKIRLYKNLFRPANFIEVALSGVKKDILLGFVLVVMVLFLFLFNARTALISAVAIPLSLLFAIIVLVHFGLSINIMVLGGLAIALGEVVDDAVIDTENIFRRLRNSEANSFSAIRKIIFLASMEVRSSVVYATLIVILIFLPLLTLGGVAGKLFAPLGYAYILAILASLFVALTLTPALCFLLLRSQRVGIEDPPVVLFLRKHYRNVLAYIEGHYRSISMGVFLAISLGVGLIFFFKNQFIPRLHEGHFIMHLTLVPGSSLHESLRVGKLITHELQEISGVRSVAQWVGRAVNGADTFGPHYSEFEIEIGSVSGETQERILRDIRERISGLGKNHPGFIGGSFAINTFLTERIEETISGYAAPVVIYIFGQDLAKLQTDASAVAKVMNEMQGGYDLSIPSAGDVPQLTVSIRHEVLSRWGLVPHDVLDAVHIVLGQYSFAKIYQDNRIIRVGIGLNDPADISAIENIPLMNLEGRVLYLKDVADIRLGSGKSKILHTGAKRIQTLTMNVDDNHEVDAFVDSLKKRIQQKVQLSAGNYLIFSGEAEENKQAQKSLFIYGLMTMLSIFLLLYVALGDLRNLFLTFFNLPFALIGGILMVFLSGGVVSIGSLVGFVTLFGITLRNTIMLVSHYRHLVQHEGRLWNFETVLLGAEERLPSILMTALVTGLGLLPLALGSQEAGREIEGPMAMVIVGGLITSTILNLLILPSLLFHFGRFSNERP